MDTASIYVLVDPRDGEVRYVGWTAKTLKNRLGRHLRDKAQTHRSRWIVELRRYGVVPIIRPVQAVPLDAVQAAEIYWIKTFREAGCRLVNCTDGGEGAVGRIVSAATRAKMSAANTGKRRTPEECRRIAEATRLGMTSTIVREKVGTATRMRNTPEMRTKISTTTREGMATPDVRAKVFLANRKTGESLRGKPRSLVVREKIAAALRARIV